MQTSAAIAIVVALVTAPAAQGPAKTLRISDAGKNALVQQMNEAVKRGDTPGVVELVVDRQGVLFEAAAGRQDIAGNTPMPANAIFNIASMTKPVTSVAIMMLMEQGTLKLDDPVSAYLDGYDKLQVIAKFDEKDGSYETRPAKRPMTIRHLLSHTSGIGYTTWSAVALRIQEKTQKSEWEQPLLNDPGDVWHYSASTRVLGFIVEKLTKSTLEDWYQQHLFKPLGMVDTSYAVAASKQPRLVTQYRRGEGGKLEELPKTPVASTPAPPFRGDGGLYSTVQDYSRFVRMLLNGGTLGSVRILSEASVKMMGENQIGSIFVEQQPAVVPARTRPMPLGAGKDKFGLGFQIASKDPANSKFRSPGSMSWAGLYNTEFWIDPVKHIGAIQMMQLLPFYDDGAIRTLRGFEEAVYRELK
ncbi:MAG TPA: serine hydrolase domain-containing protein [Vicinamibacterales bacterium]|nr:serine hydrolase domain-containing protein [Vicinamibacterales bacterium]